MTTRKPTIALPAALAALAVASLAGCTLDLSGKRSCQEDDDCLDGYTCTGANVCEATISLGPDAAVVGDGGPGTHDASHVPPPDAAFDRDGGGYWPDAGFDRDGGSYVPDAAIYPDGGTYEPDATVYPDAYVE